MSVVRQYLRPTALPTALRTNTVVIRRAEGYGELVRIERPQAGEKLSSDRLNGTIFEAEVRRIAEILYPVDGGATIIDGRERDGVYVTEDTVILIEATTLPTLAKAESDGKKLKALADQLAKKYPYKAVKAFFVTESDPTAHQRDAINRVGSPVVAISFAKFRARLVDSRAYMRLEPSTHSVAPETQRQTMSELGTSTSTLISWMRTMDLSA